MFPRWLTRAAGAAWVLTLLVGSGCGDSRDWGLRRQVPPEPTPKPADAVDPVLADTVGAQVVVGSGAPLRLRGFGVVAGLGENGGSDCPAAIREYLLDYFAREFAPRDAADGRARLSPQRLLDSPDTAVVAVHGLVPAGAPRGTRFDLQIEALGTQTRSLEGGILLPCELKRFDVAASGKGLVAGRTLARARGLVFTNPFGDLERGAAAQNARRGYALGAGRTLEDRTVRLLLQEPSYWMAQRIERRLNERFGHDPPAAQAMSRGYLTLTTPAQFADDPEHFRELATHLYLESAPELIERKLIELSRHLDEPDPVLNHIALVWEALGRTAIPHIQPLYTHVRPAVRFYAGRAGLRLGDAAALAPLTQLAEAADSPYQVLAVRELGRCRFPQAVQRLVPLLDTDDQELRIAAYEALLAQRHPAVVTREFYSVLDPTQVNLTLDVVQSGGKPLLYVRRTLEPRIAVLGPDVHLSVPLFYSHPSDWVTLNALEGSSQIAILAQTRTGRRLSDPLLVPPRVVDLICALAGVPVEGEQGQLRGIGLGYAQIVEVLDALCAAGTIPARLVLQRASVVDLLGPAERPERPETDAPAPSAGQNAGQAPPAGAEQRPQRASDWQRPE